MKYLIRRYAATLEYCECEREEKCVKYGAYWLEHGNVLDKRRVPQESNDEHVNEKNNKEYDKPLEKIRCALDVNKVLDHLY